MGTDAWPIGPSDPQHRSRQNQTNSRTCDQTVSRDRHFHRLANERRPDCAANRNQAQKIPLDQPNPVFRNFDKLGFCARLIAILESASARKDYYMARYKVHTALDSLRREFGMDEKVYQHSAPHHVNNSMAIAALKEVLARDKEIESAFKQLQHPTPKPTKKQPSKKRRR